MVVGLLQQNVFTVNWLFQQNVFTVQLQVQVRKLI